MLLRYEMKCTLSSIDSMFLVYRRTRYLMVDWVRKIWMFAVFFLPSFTGFHQVSHEVNAITPRDRNITRSRRLCAGPAPMMASVDYAQSHPIKKKKKSRRLTEAFTQLRSAAWRRLAFQPPVVLLFCCCCCCCFAFRCDRRKTLLFVFHISLRLARASYPV